SSTPLTACSRIVAAARISTAGFPQRRFRLSVSTASLHVCCSCPRAASNSCRRAARYARTKTGLLSQRRRAAVETPVLAAACSCVSSDSKKPIPASCLRVSFSESLISAHLRSCRCLLPDRGPPVQVADAGRSTSRGASRTTSSLDCGWRAGPAGMLRCRDVFGHTACVICVAGRLDADEAGPNSELLQPEEPEQPRNRGDGTHSGDTACESWTGLLWSSYTE